MEKIIKLNGAAYCAALNCYHNRVRNKNLSFFRFPKDPKRCKLWVRNCRRADLDRKDALSLYSNYQLCADHFEDSQFMNPKLKKSLVFNAVPTLFNVPNPPKLLASKRPAPKARDFQVTYKPKHKERKCAQEGELQEAENKDDGFYYEVEIDNNTNSGMLLAYVNEQHKNSSPPALINLNTEVIIENTSNKKQPATKFSTTSVASLESAEHFLTCELGLTKLPPGWAALCNSSEFMVFKIQQESIVLSVKISEIGEVFLKVLNSDIPESHQFFLASQSNSVHTFEKLLDLLQKLDQWTVCSGNSDKNFLDFISQNANTKDCKIIPQTLSLHSKKCKLLFPTEKEKKMCSVCKGLLSRLRKSLKEYE